MLDSPSAPGVVFDSPTLEAVIGPLTPLVVDRWGRVRRKSAFRFFSSAFLFLDSSCSSFRCCLSAAFRALSSAFFFASSSLFRLFSNLCCFLASFASISSCFFFSLASNRAMACELVSTRAEEAEPLRDFGVDTVGMFKNWVMGDNGCLIPDGVEPGWVDIDEEDD